MSDRQTLVEKIDPLLKRLVENDDKQRHHIADLTAKLAAKDTEHFLLKKKYDNLRQAHDLVWKENDKLVESLAAMTERAEGAEELLKKARNIMDFHAGYCPLDIPHNFSGSVEHLAEYRKVMRLITEKVGK